MAKGTRARRSQAEKRKERVEEVCPCCQGLFHALDSFLTLPRGCEDFIRHLDRARMEVLKGIRSLLDRRIEELEKAAGKKKSVEKIDIEA